MTEEEAEALLKVSGLSWYYSFSHYEYWLVRSDDLDEGVRRDGAPVWVPNNTHDVGPNKLAVFDAFIKGRGEWYDQ